MPISGLISAVRKKILFSIPASSSNDYFDGDCCCCCCCSASDSEENEEIPSSFSSRISKRIEKSFLKTKMPTCSASTTKKQCLCPIDLHNLTNILYQNSTIPIEENEQNNLFSSKNLLKNPQQIWSENQKIPSNLKNILENESTERIVNF